MKKILLSACILILASSLQAFGQQNRKPKPASGGGIVGANLKYAGQPKAVTVAGFTEAYGVALDGGVRVIKAKVAANENGGVWTFVIEKGGKVLGKWSGFATSAVLAVDAFEVLSGDLDGNGTPELIVTELETVSNGLGVRVTGVNVFRDGIGETFQAPVYFSVYEYGRNGTFVRDGDETLILAPEFGELNIGDKRGPGTYLVGRFFRFRDGHLVPAFDKPILARRLLRTFEDERGRTQESPDAPRIWLTGGKATAFKTEPDKMGKPESERAGVIQSLETVPYKAETGEMETESKLTIRFDDGKEESFRLESVFQENQLYTIGFDNGAFLVPDGIRLSALLGANVKRRVRLAQYGGEAPQTVLWIQSEK